MECKAALTGFTRDYNFSKLADVWASKVYFGKFEVDEFYKCKPSAFFVFSSRFYFSKSKVKVVNLVITLVYDFQPIVVKIVPFNSLVTTCSFAKDPSRPILFVGEECGQVSVLDLSDLKNVQWFKPNFSKRLPVLLADWLDDKCVLFSFQKELHSWNIETGQIGIVHQSANTITYFTCSPFSPSLAAVGHDDGEVIVLKFDNQEQVSRLCNLIGHQKTVCSLSFSVGKGSYSHPVLASICQDGHLNVWNLDKRDKMFDDRLCTQQDRPFRFHTVLFLDDLFVPESKAKPEETTINNPDFLKNLNACKVKKEFYFQLLATNAAGQVVEYKVPKCISGFSKTREKEFEPKPKDYRVLLYKYTKTFLMIVPRSFQSNLKDKMKKGEHHKLSNNNSFPIMIQVNHRNGCFHFAVLNQLSRRQVQLISLPANSISSVDISPLNPSMLAIADMNGFITWRLPDFESGSCSKLYDLSERRKGFFKKTPLRVTCLNWNPVKESQLAIGTRFGLIYVYDLNNPEPVEFSIQLSEEEYIYSICWGPNVLDEKPRKKQDLETSVRQSFEYLYCSLDGGKIAIANLASEKMLAFSEIADILIEKQWTELVWKSDYSLLAIGDKDGSVDIFSNSLMRVGKLKHIITIDEAFNSPIESLAFHPIFTKKDDRHYSSSYDNVIAIADTKNEVKVIDLKQWVERSKVEAESDSLPFIVNTLDKVFAGHTDRIYRLSWSPFNEMQLLSCSGDKTVKIWNCKEPADKSLVTTFYGHFSRVLVAKFSQTEPDIVISAGNDSIVYVWKVDEQTGERPKPVECITTNTVKRLEADIVDLADTGAESEMESEESEEEDGDYEQNDDSENEQEEGEHPTTKEHQSKEEHHILKDGKCRFTEEPNRGIHKVEKFNEANERVTVTYYRPVPANEKRSPHRLVNGVAAGNSTENGVSNVDDSVPNGDLNDEDDRANKRRKRKLNKAKSDTKAKSLLTLSTKFDNNLNKLEHYRDIDKMMSEFEARKKRQIERNTLMSRIKESLEPESRTAENSKSGQDQQPDQKPSDETAAQPDDEPEIEQQPEPENPKRLTEEERAAMMARIEELQSCEQSLDEDESRRSFLLYGNHKDVQRLSEKEIDNHVKNDDLDSANLVKFISGDLKTTISEAIESDQLTVNMVAMSASVSLNYWHWVTRKYVEALVRRGKIVLAAGYLLSLFDINAALDLLVKHRLYKEALLVAKTRFTSSSNVYVQAITHVLAKEYEETGNYDSEVKCWISIGYFYEAARVFASRSDSLSAKYCVVCCKIALKYELLN